jgi:threonine dehydrogenase-like Zn-dependent dehydrogenase
MQALEFRHELLRYLASRVAYDTMPRAWSARIAPLHYTDRELHVPTHPGWLRAAVRLSGICGSDLSMMTGRDSLSLEPEATYPFVPGHEIVAEITTEPVSGAQPPRADLTPGRRVAVWPVLGCRTRNHEQCDACAAGWEGLCTRRHEGWPGPGLSTGFNRDTGGGWSEACLLHTSQLWPLPDPVSDEDAVVLDAAATALGGLLRTALPHRGQTLVIGGGTIGLLCAYLDRALDLSEECELLVRHEAQRRWAADHGIRAAVVRDETGFRVWAADRSITSKRVVGHGYVYAGRYDRVVVAAASRSAMRWAIDTVRPRGTIALLAAPRDLRGLDPTRIWYREVTVRGIYDYAPVPWDGECVHPYEVLIPRLADGTLRFRDLVTHQFALADYVAAFETAVRRAQSGAIKVAFRPGSAAHAGTTVFEDLRRS